MKKAEKNVQWLVRLVSPPDAAPPRFIPARSPTLRSAVTTLIEYAEKHNFDLIAVGTHARKGVPRLFMGSFAETLIYKSPISVLISNSTASTLEEIKYVIFPSDLSDRSREVFERVVGVAKTLGVPILLFHQAQYSIQPEFVYPLIVPPVSMDSVEHSREVRRKQGQAWTAWARRNGVDAHFRLSEARGSVAENIMKVAKRLRSGIIAMATHTGPVGSTLIGSVTRQVIRTAVCPVLVFHPPPKKMTPPRKRTHRPSDSLPGRSLLS